MKTLYAARPDTGSRRNVAFHSRGYDQRSRGTDTLPYMGLYFPVFMAACGCDTLAYASGGCGAGESRLLACLQLPGLVTVPELDCTGSLDAAELRLGSGLA